MNWFRDNLARKFASMQKPAHSEANAFPSTGAAAEYPTLKNLLGAWFNQDYDKVSDDPDEILAAYRREHLPSIAHSLSLDAARFLEEHACDDDQSFTAHFKQIFKPDLDFDGWKGRTTRQFLQHIVSSMNEQRSASEK